MTPASMTDNCCSFASVALTNFWVGNMRFGTCHMH